jgi:hypothetical protein
MPRVLTCMQRIEGKNFISYSDDQDYGREAWLDSVTMFVSLGMVPGALQTPVVSSKFRSAVLRTHRLSCKGVSGRIIGGN